MAELIIAAVVVGIVVLVAWPVLMSRTRRRNPRAQDDVTPTEPVPPTEPDEPLPGSRAHRERHGKP